MRVADYIFQRLADYGVRHVFLVTGGGAMFLNNGLLHEKRITPICNHHEQGAAVAAEGYARVSGELSVVSVTTGPGGTNALTGVIGEWLDSQPVLYLSGQVKWATCKASCPDVPLRQLGDQEINIVDIVRPVTKYAAMVTEPSSIRYELEKAIWTAAHGRKGPVWLDIPINVQSAEIDPETMDSFVPPVLPPNPIPDFSFIADSFAKAKSPVIIAGQGIRLAGAVSEFRTLANRMKVPLLGTFEGFDLLPSGDSLTIGRIGTIGTRAGNIALQNADWVLCIGSRNNIRQISYNYENFVKRANSFILVDIDSAELNKPTLHPTMKICADAGDFIRGLDQALASGNWTGCAAHEKWLEWCNVRKKRYSVLEPARRNPASGVDPYVFTEILTQTLPEHAVVVCTNATPSLALFQAGIVRNGQRMICNSGCAAMGFGLPASLGAAAADPDRTVVCLEGDGSLMMNLQELQTAAANHLPIKLFLYNNDEYCSIRQTHDNFFRERIGCDKGSGVTFPDWETLAAAFRWPYLRIRSEADFGKLPEILKTPGPVFCDVQLTPGYTFAPKLSSRKMPDGTLVSPSLEDMYPFLPEEEQKENRYHA